MRINPFNVRFYEMKKTIQFILMVGVMFATGCATGPVRYKAMGFRKFATVEMTRRAHPVLKPVAAPVGVVADATVIILDTVATPIVSVPIAFELMGPCPQRTTRRNVVVKTVTAPIWFPISYPFISIGMPFREQQFYTEWFGEESVVFGKEKKIEPTTELYSK